MNVESARHDLEFCAGLRFDSVLNDIASSLNSWGGNADSPRICPVMTLDFAQNDIWFNVPWHCISQGRALGSMWGDFGKNKAISD